MSAEDADAPEIRALISKRHLQHLEGAREGTRGLLERANQLLNSATALADIDPATSVVVAYDAAKHAGMALLAARDLRPTAAGGHVAIEKALVAQFPKDFNGFRSLRRRRNELDYPSGPDDSADSPEAARAIESATRMVRAAHRICGVE